MSKLYHVYIMTNKANGTLYIGVTGNIRSRVVQHKSMKVDGFTKKYNLNKLVYLEETNDVYEAICREKQLKRWSRKKKLNLINMFNSSWCDLAVQL